MSLCGCASGSGSYAESGAQSSAVSEPVSQAGSSPCAPMSELGPLDVETLNYPDEGDGAWTMAARDDFALFADGGKSVYTGNEEYISECEQIVDTLFTAQPARVGVLGPQNDRYPRIVTTDGDKELIFNLYTGGFTVSGSAAEGKNPAPAYTCDGYAGLGALMDTVVDK